MVTNMKKNHLFVFIALLITTWIQAEKVCFFSPPPKWQLVDPSLNTQPLKVAFIHKKLGKTFHPSISLTIEKMPSTPQKYIQGAMAIHNKHRDQKCCSLGSIQTASGEGELLQIDIQRPVGAITLLQLLFFDQDHVYILSAPMLANDLPNYYDAILSAFRSLRLYDSIFEITNPKDKRFLQSLFEDILAGSLKDQKQTHMKQKKKQLLRFLEKECQSYGNYFPILVLDELQRKMTGESRS